METKTFIFFLLAFLSEMVGTVSGFGSSVFFVPLAGMLFDLKTVLALTAILHIFSTSAQVYMFRREINWKLFIRIGIPAIVFVVLGAYLNKIMELKYAELIMGLFLVGFAVAFLFFKDFSIKPTPFNAITGGTLSGFLAGYIGTGGAIRGATLTAFNLSKGAFVATSAGIDFGVDASRGIVYLWNGYLGAQYYWFIPVLMVLAFSGVFVGKKILNRIPEDVFKKFVLMLIFVVGLSMIYGFITGARVIK